MTNNPSTPVVPVEPANSISGGLVTYGTVVPAGGANNTQIDAALTPVPVVARDEVIKPPFQKELTLILLPQTPAGEQADKDLAAIQDGKSTVFRVGVQELYFHRLRRRITEKPELADKIAVFYKDHDNVLKQIDLTSGTQLKWPVGFLSELWDEEVAIQKLRQGFITR